MVLNLNIIKLKSVIQCTAEFSSLSLKIRQKIENLKRNTNKVMCNYRKNQIMSTDTSEDNYHYTS